MAEEYLNFSQALDALEITETELWELIHSGTLKAYRAGGVIKFKKSDIIAYQKSRGTEPTIVVSRKMLDSMESSEDEEEGIDTEVGLRAAKRPTQDDLATSEVTVKEPAVRRRRSDSSETAPISGRPRRASARAGAPAPSGRSSRISQVLETEKKGNPIMNAILIVSIIVCIYQGLVLYATVRNTGVDKNGAATITKPSFIFDGLFQWGREFGAGTRYTALKADLDAKGIDYTEGTSKSEQDMIQEFEKGKKAEENPEQPEDEENADEPEEPEEAPEE